MITSITNLELRIDDMIRKNKRVVNVDGQIAEFGSGNIIMTVAQNNNKSGIIFSNSTKSYPVNVDIDVDIPVNAQLFFTFSNIECIDSIISQLQRARAMLEK